MTTKLLFIAHKASSVIQALHQRGYKRGHCSSARHASNPFRARPIYTSTHRFSSNHTSGPFQTHTHQSPLSPTTWSIMQQNNNSLNSSRIQETIPPNGPLSSSPHASVAIPLYTQDLKHESPSLAGSPGAKQGKELTAQEVQDSGENRSSLLQGSRRSRPRRSWKQKIGAPLIDSIDWSYIDMLWRRAYTNFYCVLRHGNPDHWIHFRWLRISCYGGGVHYAMHCWVLLRKVI